MGAVVEKAAALEAVAADYVRAQVHHKRESESVRRVSE